jgi:hypothetical protein
MILLNLFRNVEVSDTRKDDSSNKADPIKKSLYYFFNMLKSFKYDLI